MVEPAGANAPHRQWSGGHSPEDTISDTEKPQALDEAALAEVAGGVVQPPPVFGGGIPGVCPIFGGAGSTATVASDETVVINPGPGVVWG